MTLPDLRCGKVYKRLNSFISPLLLLFREAPRYADNADALEQLFLKHSDPWSFLSSPYEQERLARLAGVVKRVPHASVLEIGCANGVFTAWLSTVAGRVVALDVSPTACALARERAPKATVFEQDVREYTHEGKLDLVVCAETLYYASDPVGMISAMRELGAHVLVSYTRREQKRLDLIVAEIPAMIDETFVYKAPGFFSKKRGCRFLVWGPISQTLAA